MRLKCSFAAVLLVLVVQTAVAQTKPNDSQTLEAILAEIRQLREDLRTATVAAQRAQILVYRVQLQEAVVRHLQDRTDDTRSKLAQTQYEEKRLMTTAKQMEEALDQSENPKVRKENEQTIARLKAGIQAQSNSEQEAQKRLIELEEQLRFEQDKLAQLQDELDRLDKTLR